MRMGATKGNIVWNMRVRSNEKAKPKGHQHQQNRKALFTEAFLYSRVEGRLSGVTVIAVLAVNVVAIAIVAVVVVVVVVVIVLVVVNRRR